MKLAKTAAVLPALAITLAISSNIFSLSSPRPDFTQLRSELLIDTIDIAPPASITAQWISDYEAVKYKTFTYSIATDGATQSDLTEFSRQVAETLNDPRGWPRANVKFKEVTSKPQFTIYLSEPARIGAYSGCSSELSCRSGNRVMINDDRWRLASNAWLNAGGTLRDYRHLIVNHEVGHWLGHRHITTPCKDTSVIGPLMMESSIRHSCAPNSWPLESELWTSR